MKLKGRLGGIVYACCAMQVTAPGFAIEVANLELVSGIWCQVLREDILALDKRRNEYQSQSRHCRSQFLNDRSQHEPIPLDTLRDYYQQSLIAVLEEFDERLTGKLDAMNLCLLCVIDGLDKLARMCVYWRGNTTRMGDHQLADSPAIAPILAKRCAVESEIAKMRADVAYSINEYCCECNVAVNHIDAIMRACTNTPDLNNACIGLWEVIGECSRVLRKMLVIISSDTQIAHVAIDASEVSCRTPTRCERIHKLWLGCLRRLSNMLRFCRFDTRRHPRNISH
jgi:hypothetical protein